MIANGGCLCGGIKFEVEVALAKCNSSPPLKKTELKENESLDVNDALNYPSSPSQILVCSCSMCRQASGAAALPFAAFPRDKINFFNQLTLKTYQSSDVVRRGFCGNCGAQIYMDYSEKYSLWIALGLIKNLEEILDNVFEYKHGMTSPSKITYPGCHVFSESRDEMLNQIMNILPEEKGYGLYVQDPCEPLNKPFSEKKPHGGDSYEELKSKLKLLSTFYKLHTYS